MHILLIETSTEKGLVALFKDWNLLKVSYLPPGLQNSKYLMTAIGEVCPQGQAIDLVACGVGPGSYTGLRVGAMTAQAIAYGKKIPVIGVTSLKGFAPDKPGPFGAIIDARIGGAYFLEGIKEGKEVKWMGEPQACPLDKLPSLAELAGPSQEPLLSKVNFKTNFTEMYPDPDLLIAEVKRLWQAGPPEKLEMLYLRKTQAELEKGSIA